MDPSRGGDNNQQWHRFTSNVNSSNIADENDSEEKTSPGQNLPPTNDTLTAQYVLQQSLLQQLHDEERQRRQQLQIYQFIQNQQRETQLRQLYEQEIQNSRISAGELSVERTAILQLQLQQHRLEQERRIRNEQQIQQQSQRLLQQQLLRGHQLGQSVESLLLQREREELSILNRTNPAMNFDVGSIHGRPIFEDTRSITSNANIAAVDASIADLTRVEAGRHPQASPDVGVLPEASSPHAMLLRPWSETSAELLKKMESENDGSDQAAPKKKNASRKKSADMPKRPLHAYNIFFQQERQAILANLPEPKPDAEAATKEKRRRRATHGKISFASLAKEIGQKWQTLDKKEKERFQHLAEIDLKRYDDEMEAFNQQQKPAAKEQGKDKTKTSSGENDGDPDIESAGETSRDTGSSSGYDVAKKRKV